MRPLDDTIRAWLGLPAASGLALPELPEALARRLLRAEERESSHRDAWGNWEFGFCEAFGRGALETPEVDGWVREQLRALTGRAELVARWPGEAPYAVCLTHDVDVAADGLTARQAARRARARVRRLPSGADGPRGRVVRGLGALAAGGVVRGAPDAGAVLGRCVAIERSLGVRGSYLVPVHAGEATNPYDICVTALEDPVRWDGAVAPYGDVLAELASEGFDVGLHGSYRSALDGAVLRDERERLEAAVRAPVRTSRQHWLHLDVARTPALQAAAGLRADSTLGFNRGVGFRAGSSLPFRLPDAPEVLQVPLVVQESALVSANALELDGDGADAASARLQGTVRDGGGVFTLLVHPHALVDPAVERVLRATIERALRDGAWVATLAEIEAHWSAREAALS